MMSPEPIEGLRRDPVTELVAHNIEILMKARDLDPARLARRANLGYTGIYDILNGNSRNPTLSTVAKIAAALDVPVTELFRKDRGQALPQAPANWRDLLDLFDQMPEVQRDLLLITARAWIAEQPVETS